ncbi:hypothetical protein AB9K26_09225 [Psychroserpens sp. XS_ASV72]|uniref:hypothetical protein n=1 Tax=Psychroserpens sp. XS_ASV72 TaxID=3241293 RepID=UPI0035194770
MLYTLLIILLSFNYATAQQYPPVKDASLAIEEKVNDLANQYDRQLAMTAKQKALFKLKLEDYLLRRIEIEDKYNGKNELTMLAKLQARETQAMNDVLTQPQMEVYKRIKPEIQPLKVVKEK